MAGPAIRAVIYDHDGTLINSLPLVVAATNGALAEAGFATCPASDIISAMVHPTGPRMGLHAGVDDSVQQTALAAAFYRIALSLEAHHATLYDGVPDLLRAVARPQAVVSNNQGVLIRRILIDHGVAEFFGAIYGEEDIPAPKPDGRGLLLAAHTLGIAPEHCIYVGDSSVDALAAHAACMRSVGVTWGIHSRDYMQQLRCPFTALVDRPNELLQLLG